MAGRSRIGLRLVSLMAAAATLLAAWLPPGRACACGTTGSGSPIPTATREAPACPCCGSCPAPGKAPKPCCAGQVGAALPGEPKGCECTPVGLPDQPQPAAPPRPTNSDDTSVMVAGSIAPAWVNVVLTGGPTTAELAVRQWAPPPIDLVISLSRLTC